MKLLTDRVAVVTGAGSGIGRALALELARRGCHVAITDRDAAVLEPVAAGIRELGRKASIHGFDVADREAWPRFVDALKAEHGAVHLVVNNAGVSLTGPFASCSLDDLDWQLRVNLYGVMYGCHHLIPLLAKQGEAHIVNVSSIFGIITVPESAAYCMSKHAVRSLTEALEMELAGTSIHVSSVHPGAVATRIVLDGRFREGGRTDADNAKKMIASGMAPEQAAIIIADGIQRNRRRILVGNDAKMLALMQWWMPLRYRDVVGWWVRRQRAPG